MPDPKVQAAATDHLAAAVAPVAAGESAEADPLASLHRMQTVAGVASQTYVAINGLAVVALILGLASFTVFVLPILAVIPVAAVICSIIALLHIRSSNGTEAGRALAIGGLATALLAGGGAVGTQVYEHMALRQDTQQISSLLDTFGKNLHDGKYGGAYRLFSGPFQAHWPADRFRAQLEEMQKYTGPFESIEWNGVEPAFYNSGNRGALVRAVIKCQKSEQRFDVTCVKLGDHWIIYDIPDLFPEPSENRGGR